MHVVADIILVGWILFWIYWLAVSFAVKSGRSTWGRFAGCRVALVLIVLLLFRARVFKGQPLTDNRWLEGVGLAIFVSGLALAVWARLYLGRNWGTPMSVKDEPELVTSGPYARIRHPIYAGLILATVGTALAVSLYWLVTIALVGGYFIYSATVEERNLTSAFPDTYPAYQAATKMLIPFVL
jgi:protein-S-isoprenylcysteine O-methyltransferase Ste14